MTLSRAGTRILLLDVCHAALDVRTRDGETSEQLLGFKPNTLKGMVIFSACLSSQTALELTKGREGLFTRTLIEYATKHPSMDLLDLAKIIKAAVSAEAAQYDHAQDAHWDCKGNPTGCCILLPNYRPAP